jgi:secondary thiamine-phosphate synthase enzyme
MTVFTQRKSIDTRGYCDIQDITPLAENMLLESGLKEGVANIFVAGSTASITTIEFESGAVQDLRAAIQRLAPENITYEHDKRWGDGNGFSHVRAAMMKPGLCIPFQDGQLIMGTWQQLILIDFDNKPRTREIIFQFIGS